MTYIRVYVNIYEYNHDHHFLGIISRLMKKIFLRDFYFLFGSNRSKMETFPSSFRSLILIRYFDFGFLQYMKYESILSTFPS